MVHVGEDDDHDRIIAVVQGPTIEEIEAASRPCCERDSAQIDAGSSPQQIDRLREEALEAFAGQGRQARHAGQHEPGADGKLTLKGVGISFGSFSSGSTMM
eukprot:CAMPEP_0204300472 /NCGR_PEP_ID=MMETSP0468-20130131/78683_1 /ASSEMBLY_ACC=CAM_ASM_000383 /TAXON_ID=2969 /ORGANISM="Oxyrrhis marina" /LENGTH=100 /DNA_ID=CAMNT_0051279541 /DNA_START=75 /DNA_END=378 /DNA_ORIENTATION=-